MTIPNDIHTQKITLLRTCRGQQVSVSGILFMDSNHYNLPIFFQSFFPLLHLVGGGMVTPPLEAPENMFSLNDVQI